MTRTAYHFGETSCGDNVARMNQSIEMPCAFLNLLPHVIFHFHVEDIRDQVKRILVVLNFGVESGEVEPVSQVVLVNFAEVFVAP